MRIDGGGKVGKQYVRWGGLAEYEVRDGKRVFVRMIDGSRIEDGKLVEYSGGKVVKHR